MTEYYIISDADRDNTIAVIASGDNFNDRLTQALQDEYGQVFIGITVEDLPTDFKDIVYITVLDADRDAYNIYLTQTALY